MDERLEPCITMCWGPRIGTWRTLAVHAELSPGLIATWPRPKYSGNVATTLSIADPSVKRTVERDRVAAAAIAFSSGKSRTQAETLNWRSRRSRSRRLSSSILTRNWNTAWEGDTKQLYYIPYSA